MEVELSGERHQLERWNISRNEFRAQGLSVSLPCWLVWLPSSRIELAQIQGCNFVNVLNHGRLLFPQALTGWASLARRRETGQLTAGGISHWLDLLPVVSSPVAPIEDSGPPTVNGHPIHPTSSPWIVIGVAPSTGTPIGRIDIPLASDMLTFQRSPGSPAPLLLGRLSGCFEWLRTLYLLRPAMSHAVCTTSRDSQIPSRGAGWAPTGALSPLLLGCRTRR